MISVLQHQTFTSWRLLPWFFHFCVLCHYPKTKHLAWDFFYHYHLKTLKIWVEGNDKLLKTFTLSVSDCLAWDLHNEVSSSKHLSCHSKGLVFWVKLITRSLLSAVYLSSVVSRLLHRSGVHLHLRGSSCGSLVNKKSLTIILYFHHYFFFHLDGLVGWNFAATCIVELKYWELSLSFRCTLDMSKIILKSKTNFLRTTLMCTCHLWIRHYQLITLYYLFVVIVFLIYSFFSFSLLFFLAHIFLKNHTKLIATPLPLPLQLPKLSLHLPSITTSKTLTISITIYTNYCLKTFTMTRTTCFIPSPSPPLVLVSFKQLLTSFSCHNLPTTSLDIQHQIYSHNHQSSFPLHYLPRPLDNHQDHFTNPPFPFILICLVWMTGPGKNSLRQWYIVDATWMEVKILIYS